MSEGIIKLTARTITEFSYLHQDWRKLYNGMKNSLHEHFSNDNVSTDNEVSNMWNSIFIDVSQMVIRFYFLSCRLSVSLFFKDDYFIQT